MVVLQPQVVITLVAAGAVDDYDQSTRADLREALASETGVSVDDVALTIEAASVVMRFDVNVESEAAGAQLVTSLSTSMSTASAASSLLGVQVESTPQLEAVVTRIVVVVPSPSTPPPSGPSGGGGLIGAIAGGGGAGMLLVLLLLYCWYRHR